MDFGKYIKDYSDYMALKGMAETTQRTYSSALKSFIYSFNLRPTDISDAMIKKYLLGINGRSNRCIHHNAVKLFYRKVLKCKFKLRYIPYPDKEDKLPIHVNKEEFLKIFSVCDNMKHKAIICLMFDSGLRVSEVRDLKISDIDSSNMLINVVQGKGNKDRKVKLTIPLLSILRSYYMQYKPQKYLFEGQNCENYSVSSCQKIVKRLVSRAGITKKFTPHKMRHGFAMTLLENGSTLDEIRNQLGHKSNKTTEIYARMNNSVIQRIESPLEQIIRENQVKQNILASQ